ncbi:MAG: flavin reductase family protein [Candidatus Heimdallarchaeota archaeon]
MLLKNREYTKVSVRPTVVITTVSKRGTPNAAPFSFNSPCSFNPPLFGFGSLPTHDTWRNIMENGEFVANYVDESFGPLMHILEKNWPYEVSEIEKAGLSGEKAHKIKPPRIKEAYAWLECKIETYIEIGDHIWIVGRVLEAEVKDKFIQAVTNVEKVKALNHIWGEYFADEMKVTKYKRAERISS